MEDLKGVGTPPISAEDREELERLRREHSKLKERLSEKNKHDKDDSDNSDESEVISDVSFKKGWGSCSRFTANECW